MVPELTATPSPPEHEEEGRERQENQVPDNKGRHASLATHTAASAQPQGILTCLSSFLSLTQANKLQRHARALQQQQWELSLHHSVLKALCELLHSIRTGAVHPGWIDYVDSCLPDELPLLSELGTRLDGCDPGPAPQQQRHQQPTDLQQQQQQPSALRQSTSSTSEPSGEGATSDTIAARSISCCSHLVPASTASPTLPAVAAAAAQPDKQAAASPAAAAAAQSPAAASERFPLYLSPAVGYYE